PFYPPYAQSQAALALGWPVRRLPEFDKTSVVANPGPRESHKVNVTLEPALPPLGWKTKRVRPAVERRCTLAGSARPSARRVSLGSGIRLPLMSAKTIQPLSQLVD